MLSLCLLSASHHRQIISVSPMMIAFSDAHLKKSWEHIGWLAPDNKKPRVQLTKASIKILQTLKEKPEKDKDNHVIIFWIIGPNIFY